MTAWEYKTVTRKMNTKEEKWYWTDTNQHSVLEMVDARLNELGSQGWELVSVVAKSTLTGAVKDWGMVNGYTSMIDYVFKRQKS